MSTTKNTFIVNDDSEVNSYGFRVKTEGIKTLGFTTNPVMLLNHNYDNVLGKWNDLQKVGTKMTAVPEFDADDEAAVKIEKKVTKNLIKGSSIGILPLKAIMGEDGIPEVTESELIEISITPLPSNKGAIKLYAAAGKEMPLVDGKYDLSVLTEITNPINTNTMQKKEFFVLQLNLDSNASEEAILKAVTDVVKERNELKTQLATQKTKLEAFEAAEIAAKDSKIIELVTGASKANKILKADEDKYIKLAKQDFDTTKGILDSLQPFKNSSDRINNDGGGDSEKYKDWDFNKLHTEAPLELTRIKTEEPERYEKLKKGLKK